MSSRGEQPPDQFPHADVGRQITAAREAKGWNKVELARQANIDQSVITKYEKGERLPKAATRARLERALELPPRAIARWAGLVEDSATLEEHLAGRPLLTPADRDLIMRLVERLEGQNVLKPT